MKKITCIECARQYEADLMACPNCGCPNEAMLTCPENAIKGDKSCLESNDSSADDEVIATGAVGASISDDDSVSVADSSTSANVYSSVSDDVCANSSEVVGAAGVGISMDGDALVAGAEHDATKIVDSAAEHGNKAEVCRECGELVPFGEKACPNCGCPLCEDEVQCIECDGFYPSQLLACPVCGCPNELLGAQKRAEMQAITELELMMLKQKKAQQTVLNGKVPSIEPNVSLEEHVMPSTNANPDLSGGGTPSTEGDAPSMQGSVPSTNVDPDLSVEGAPSMGGDVPSVDANNNIVSLEASTVNAEDELVNDKKFFGKEKLSTVDYAEKEISFADDPSRSIINTMKRVFTRCTNFSSRARRSEFWAFVVCNVVLGFVVYMIMFACIGHDYISVSNAPSTQEYFYRLIECCLSKHLFATLLGLAYLLLTALPLIAVMVRRLHDTGRSGLWILLGVVPFFLGEALGFSPWLGVFFLSLMLLLDSVPDNKWGKRYGY